MKVSKKLTGVMVSAVMSISAVSTGYAEGPADIPDIYASFDEEVSMASRYDQRSAWVYLNADTYSYVSANNLFGRTAEETDKVLKLTNTNAYSNYLRFFPTRGSGADGESWGSGVTVPPGQAIETSFSFAVDFASEGTKSGNIKFTINSGAGTSIPLTVNIPHMDKRIGTITTGDGKSYTVNKNLNDASDSTAWHDMRIVTLYTGETADESAGTQKGLVSVYLDDELLSGNTIEFTYSGTTTGSDGWKYKDQSSGGTSPWDNNNIWNFTFENVTYKDNPSDLYIDDFKMHALDYTSLNNAIQRAEEELAEYGDTYPQSAVAAMQTKINAAKTYAAQTETLLSQPIIEREAEALLAALDELANGELEIVPDIYASFDEEVSMASRYDQKSPWMYLNQTYSYETANGLFGRTAEETDKVLKLTNTNSYSNWLRFFPTRGSGTNGESWGSGVTIPPGQAVETSFSFAVDFASEGTGSGYISFTVNGSSGASVPVSVNIPHMDKVINKITTGDGKSYTVNKNLNDESDNTAWHDMRIVTLYTGETADESAGTKKGLVSVYLDDELLSGNTIEFTYSGTTTGSDGWKYKDQSSNGTSPWDNNNIWNFTIDNITNKDNPSDLYIDNFRMHAVNEKKAAFRKALDQAYTLAEEAEIGTGLGQYEQKDIDMLKGFIVKAYTVYNGKTTDYDGNTSGGTILFTQSQIDTAYAELADAMTEFKNAAVSQELGIARSGNTITAGYTKNLLDGQSMEVRVIVAVYNSDGVMIGAAQDSGNGILSAAAGDEVKHLSAEIDISQMQGAFVARAYAWNSLSAMEPLIPSQRLKLE